MEPARIYPWRKMRRSRAPSIAPDTFFVAQSWADCITNMAGFNFRQPQGASPDSISVASKIEFPTGTGDLQHQSASTRLSRAGTGFGAMVAAGRGVRVTLEVAALFAATSARTGATFIAFNRARTSGVRPGKDATGVKSGVWSLPTRRPEYATSPSVVASTSPGRSESSARSTGARPAGLWPLQVQSARSAFR